MRKYILDDAIIVAVSKDEVSHFATRWPCFGKVRAMRFTFDLNGNLLDLSDDRGMDGNGVSVLCDDAKEYALSA